MSRILKIWGREYTCVGHAQTSRLVASLDEETRYAGCIRVLLLARPERHVALPSQASGPALNGQLGIDDPELAQQPSSGQGVGEETRPLDASLQLLLPFALLLGLGLLGLPLLDVASGPCCVGWGSGVCLDLEVALLLLIYGLISVSAVMKRARWGLAGWLTG